MKFKSINSVSFASSPHQSETRGIRALLEAGKRLASILPLCVQSETPHPLTRFASVGVIRAQVRLCIAALGNAGEGELAGLRAQMSKAVRLIHRAPNEATARAVYNSPQVQQTVWAWATAEAAIYVHNMTKHVLLDADKQADLVADAVLGFVREEAVRDGATKLHPFSMARTWEPARMDDPLGTLRKYLYAWCKKMVQAYWQERSHEGVSLDAPAGGAGAEGRASIGELVEDRSAKNPETALLERNDHRSQVAALAAIYERQITGLESDILAFDGRTDTYSVSQRNILRNRLDAIKEMVGPLLVKLRNISEAISAMEADQSLSPSDRKRELARLREQFAQAMQNLNAISEAQERVHGARLEREENRPPQTTRPKGLGGTTELVNQPSTLPRGKKLPSDPITTEQAYTRARENAERLLPYMYRALTHRHKTDLAKKYTSGLMTNWKLLDGINSQRDLNSALSSNPSVRASANDRALFTTTALRVAMILRDLYTYDEKYKVFRGDDEQVPRGAKQRFVQLLGQEIERDPVLRSRAPQQFDLLKEFVSSNGFLTLWASSDYLARGAAYEWARNEKVNRRWDELSPEESNVVADAAGGLLYDNDYRPFAARSQGDAQNRVTKDLNLTPEERQEIMRQEVTRITGMLRGDLPRGTWAHGEPVDSKRFHDKLRAVQPAPLPTVIDDYTTSTAAPVIRTRRFAMAKI